MSKLLKLFKFLDLNSFLMFLHITCYTLVVLQNFKNWIQLILWLCNVSIYLHSPSCEYLIRLCTLHRSRCSWLLNFRVIFWCQAQEGTSWQGPQFYATTLPLIDKGRKKQLNSLLEKSVVLAEKMKGLDKHELLTNRIDTRTHQVKKSF